MNSKMYVGNLLFDAGDQEINELFSQYGEVTDVHIVKDRESGRPRGFAFVTMSSKEEMDKAIEGLDGYEFLGRNLTVNEARPRENRPSYGGGGGGGRGNDRRGGGRDRGDRGGDRW